MSVLRAMTPAWMAASGATGMVERCRMTFALLNVVNAAATVVAMLAGGQPGSLVALSIAATCVLAFGQWRTLRRRRAGLVDEAAVAAGMLVGSLALPDATMTVSLVFSAVMFRSLYGPHASAGLRSAMYVAVYAAGLHLAASSGRLDTAVEAALLLPLPALVMSTVTMRVLYVTTVGRDAAAARQAVLAHAAAELLSAADRDSAVAIVWRAQRELVRGRSAIVLLLAERGGGQFQVEMSTAERLVGRSVMVDVQQLLRPGEREPVTTREPGTGLVALAADARWWALIPNAADEHPTRLLVIAGADRPHRDVVVSSQALMRQASLALAAQAHRTELHRQAWHDGLTELPNRKQFMHRLAEHASGSDRAEIAVMFLDLDGFKPVNDRYGHAAGDELLVALSRRLLGAVRDDVLVARLGGDEFAVLVTGVRRRDDVYALAERLEAVVNEPVVLGRGDAVTVGVSIGVHLVRPPYDPDQVLHAADEAMYTVKAGRQDRRRAAA